jgi:hypothetical protein
MLYVSYKFTTGPRIGRKMLKITFKFMFLRQDRKMSEEHHLFAHGSSQLSPTFLAGTWIVMAACVKFQESLLALTLFVMECRLRGIFVYEEEYPPQIKDDNFPDRIVDFEMAILFYLNYMIYVMQEYVSMFRGISFSITLETTLEKSSDGKIMKRKFHSVFIKVTHRKFIVQKLAVAHAYINASLSLYKMDGRGWRVKSVDKIILRILPYLPSFRRQTQPSRSVFRPIAQRPIERKWIY